jgi:hypothetical protein
MDVFSAAEILKGHGWRFRQGHSVPGGGSRAALDAPDGTYWGILQGEGESGLTITCQGLNGTLTIPGLTLAQVQGIAEANR